MKTFLVVAALACAFSTFSWATDLPTLTLDLGKPGHAVSPMLYGLMTEEINHSYDGGLYAELIQNRTFQDEGHTPLHWSMVQERGGGGSISFDGDHPIEGTALTTCLKLDATGASAGHRVGIANDGWWGIPVHPKTTYRASFYARGDVAFRGPLTVSIESNDGAKIFAAAQVQRISLEWEKYAVTLTTGDDITPSANNRFVIATEKPGSIRFNLVSLFPPTFRDRPNGNRSDLMQKLIDMKPAFLRLPGGNYLEGATIATRFPWKKSLHDIAERPGHPGCWNYRSSDGLGLLEYLEWCEDMHAQPLLAVYAGLSLKAKQVVAGPDLQPFVDEALDEIEYVTGDVKTKWGAERAKDGHPDPFPLRYIEIGNEDQFDGSHSYDARFARFYDAIKAKFPWLQLIATTRIKSRRPDIIDDHLYPDFDHMVGSEILHPDQYDRAGPKIFIGEWATTEGRPTNNLHAALADAAWMTALERNSDIIVMSSYAPLFANVNPGGTEWTPDLIGCDALTCYGSPSYYAQKMFHNNIGDVVVPIASEGVPTRTWQPPAPKDQPAPPARQVPTLFFVATKESATGTIDLKVVNTAAMPQPAQINLAGAATIAPEGIAITLSSAQPDDTNSITEPAKVVPATEKIGGLGGTFTHTFAPYSINVLKIETK